MLAIEQEGAALSHAGLRRLWLGQLAPGEPLPQRAHAHLGGILEGIAVDPAADGGEGDAAAVVLAGRAKFP